MIEVGRSDRKFNLFLILQEPLQRKLKTRTLCFFGRRNERIEELRFICENVTKLGLSSTKI
jgi:hypothetical protein